MSNKNRVNPDYYRQAGRDPQGATLTQERQKQLFARERASRPPSPRTNLIPGGDRAPVAMAARGPARAARPRITGKSAGRPRRGTRSGSTAPQRRKPAHSRARTTPRPTRNARQTTRRRGTTSRRRSPSAA